MREEGSGRSGPFDRVDGLPGHVEVVGKIGLRPPPHRSKLSEPVVSGRPGFDDLAEGTVYPALTRLQTKGLLSSRLVPSTSGPARKYYRTTAAGVDELERALAGWLTSSENVERVMSSPIPNIEPQRRCIDVGLRVALAKLGSLRRLAANTSHEGQLRSRWLAGFTAAVSALAVSLVVFLFLTMYYAEGVLDANATESVASSLFPYFGSNVTVDPSNGLEFPMQPGPLPLVLAIAVWLVVAAPWRSLGHRSGAMSDAEVL